MWLKSYLPHCAKCVKINPMDHNKFHAEYILIFTYFLSVFLKALFQDLFCFFCT